MEEKSNKIEEKKEENLSETKSENLGEKEKIEEEKKEEKQKLKKDEAIVRGMGLHASKKHSMYVCSFIKNKSIDRAIDDLIEVTKFKKIVPFKGEIPHRKGKGIMAGRYPIKTAKLFIKLLKGLRGNAMVNNLDLDKIQIVMANASWATRPMRSEGRLGKRTNVLLKAMEVE